MTSLLWLLAACTTDPLDELTLVSEDPSDVPVAGLSAEWMGRFNGGDAAFEALFRESQGLGPAYIRASCGSCHADDARGPGVVFKMSVPSDPELEATLLPFGHTERPYVSGGASTPILAPEDSRVLVSTRSPPAVFGRGAMEAIPDETLLALEAAQAEAGRVSGRINWVPCDVANNPESLFPSCESGQTVIGRFGLKARIPTLDAFAADAYQGDMSITTALRPDELANPDGLSDDALPGVDLDTEALNLTADYMRLLAIPKRAPTEGAALFADAGCADCHVPTLRTAEDWPLEPFRGQEVALYTDLLLHDMGAEASDGLTDHDAGPSEWRTAPLMGLRFLRSYLHDGSAMTIEEAIDGHGLAGSEAADSVEQFYQLPSADQAALIAYVESL